MSAKKLLGFGLLLALMCLPCSASAATYYIDYTNGANTNAGTVKTAPWKHAPGMAGVTGVPASHTIIAGDSFIFKGGIVWPNATMGWRILFRAASASTVPVGCAGPGCVYIGVDQTYYDATACAAKGYPGFCRPVFDAEGALVATNDAGFYNVMLDVYNGYVVVDNLEFKGFAQLDDHAAPSYGVIALRCEQHCEVKNVYVHGWSHGGTATKDLSQILSSPLQFPPDYTSSVHDSVFDGSDTTNDMMMLMKGAIGFFYRNYVAYMRNGLLGEQMYVWGNTFTHQNRSFDPTSHGNVVETLGGRSIIYNNLIDDTDGGACLFPGPIPGYVDYIFNNVIINQGVQAIQISGRQLSTMNVGAGIYIFNNTIQTIAGNNSAPIAGPSDAGYLNLPFITAWNNHLIGDRHAVVFGSHTTTMTEAGTVGRTNAEATTDGYRQNATYPYMPPTATGSTVGRGTDLRAVCAAIPSVPIYADAANACLSDTTAGVAYDALNHVVVTPSRRAAARAQSQGWDVGSYSWNGPAAPTNVKIVR